MSAFVSTTLAVRSPGAATAQLRARGAMPVLRHARAHRHAVVMMADKEPDNSAAADGKDTAKDAADVGGEEIVSKDDILSQLEADVAADPLKSGGQFDGKTWDGDGRQNNWAVEPKESIEGTEQTDKKRNIIFLVGAIAIAFAALLPYINFSNPNQI